MRAPPTVVFTGIFYLLLVTLGLGAPLARAGTAVIVGDSISAGYGVDSQSGWVALFSHKLVAQQIALNVVNESISGDTSAGGLVRLPNILQRHQPEIVIIELGGNDGLRGLSPQALERNLEAMIELCLAANSRVYLLGMKLPPNYGQGYNQRFEAAFVNAAQGKNIPLLPFFLQGVGGNDALMQADRVHPNRAGHMQLAENAWRFLEQHLNGFR
jgi:acyl-CoA thioesterase-1